MPLTRTQAQYLLDLLKGRSLVMIDDKRAHSPFAYDKKFFDKLRPDQVPRFLRCITDPWKLPVQLMKINKLACLQDRVDVEKVESIRNSGGLKPPVVVRIRKHGADTIADGLHRSTADWLDHRDEIPVYYCDLSDKRETVEPVPGAGQFNHRTDEVEQRSADGSET